jgi:TctA family transporter
LRLSDGSFLIFIDRPIAAIGTIATLLMLISCILPSLRKKREIIAGN